MRNTLSVALLFALFALSGCGGGGSKAGTAGAGTVTGVVTWSAASSPTTNSLYSVVWTGSSFVAFGDRVKASSTDGVNWAAQATTIVIDSAVWDGTKFVGLTRDTVWGTYIIRTSNDGITWTDSLNVGSTGGTIDSNLIWANNKFFALGKDATGATTSYISNDGITWTANANTTATTFHSVIWDGNKYVAVGNKVSGSTATAASSLDGITWQLVTLPTTANLQSVAYNGTTYVVTSPGNTGSDVYTTTDGINWTKIALVGPYGTIDFGNSIIWAGNKFVGVGWWWRVLSSPNGSTWTEETSGGASYVGMYTNLYSVAYSGTRYVAVGYGGRIMHNN